MSEQLSGPPGHSKVDSLGSMSEQLLGPPGHSKVVADVGSDDDSRDSYSDKASIDVVGPPSVLPWACSIDVAGPPLVLPGAGSIDAVGPPSLLPGACSIDAAGPPLGWLPGAARGWLRWSSVGAARGWLRWACSIHGVLRVQIWCRSCTQIDFGATASCSLVGSTLKAKAIAMPCASPLRLGHIAAVSLGMREHHIT